MGVALNTRHVLIIGGGLAGLSAAVALASRNIRCTILESRQRLGGRASSFHDPLTGDLVDACQHVSMGCCTAFAEFCRTVGIGELLEPQPTLWFMTPDRRISAFGADRLPAPLHLARSLWRAHYLTLADKIRIGWGMLALRLAHADDDQPLRPWLRRHRQNDATIERFWSIVLVSALNESIDNLGLKYARKVFVDAFLTDRRGFEVSIPTVPLGRLYGDELQRWFDAHGVTVETGAGVSQINVSGDSVTSISLRDGRQLTADGYVTAVPSDRLRALLSPEVVAQYAEFDNLKNLSVSPITSVHFWFDRPVMTLPHVVLVDCQGQWVFRRQPHYLQVVVSAARSLKLLGSEEIRQRIHAELCELFPEVAAATVVRAKVVTEHAATFSPLPDVDRWRPNQSSPIANLALAGDWTATGWPATMEGAVRSGTLAADALCPLTG